MRWRVSEVPIGLPGTFSIPMRGNESGWVRLTPTAYLYWVFDPHEG